MEKEFWNSMLDADLFVRYWFYLSKRYYDRDTFLKIFLAVMSSGTVASWGFWSQISWLWKVLSAVSMLISIALPILNWQKMIERMSLLKGKWTQIENEYELLWLTYKNKSNNNLELEKQFRKIKEMENKISEIETNLPYDKKLLGQCYDEVLASRGLNSK